MEIQGIIRHFEPYRAMFEPKALETYSLDDVRQGLALRRNAFYLTTSGQKFAVSKWTGPKRTRTYPYQHVYDTLHHKPKVTLIPYVKDEGKDGDRDFLQWDTVSLMTLLGVFVVLTYHVGAERSYRRSSSPQKITHHQLDTAYILQRLEDLVDYHHDAVHWNHREMTEVLPTVIDQAIAHYPVISAQTGVTLKNIEELRRRRDNLKGFQSQSRLDAFRAQRREQLTDHLHERSLMTAKSTITITNFFNGEYYFTVDEAHLIGKKLLLVEKKHGRGIMPSSADIKDGLLKLVLYHNLESVMVNGHAFTAVPVLGMTTDRMVGFAHNAMNNAELNHFWQANPGIGVIYRRRLDAVFAEANHNGFFAYLSQAEADALAQEALFRSVGNLK